MASFAAQKRVRSASLRHLALGLAFALPSAGWSSTHGDRYAEALAQISYQRIPVNDLVKSSIKVTGDRFPGAVLAACAPTGSMKPTLDENCLAVLTDCPFGRLARGDIILIRLGPTAKYAAVMHRVVDRAGMGSLQTRGDALKHADSVLTTGSNYLGKRVVAAIHLQTGKIRWLTRENPPPSSRMTARP